MNVFASLLLGVVISQLPPSEFADTEATTNIPFAVSVGQQPSFVLEVQ